MRKYIYVIVDKFTCQRNPMFEAINDTDAVRLYRSIMKDCPHPSDFMLYRIGFNEWHIEPGFSPTHDSLPSFKTNGEFCDPVSVDVYYEVTHEDA